METTLRDLRYALRMLRRSPGFTVIAVLALMLGIASTTVIFSVVDGVLLRPLSYPESDRIVSSPGKHPQHRHLTACGRAGQLPRLAGAK